MPYLCWSYSISEAKLKSGEEREKEEEDKKRRRKKHEKSGKRKPVGLKQGCNF